MLCRVGVASSESRCLLSKEHKHYREKCAVKLQSIARGWMSRKRQEEVRNCPRDVSVSLWIATVTGEERIESEKPGRVHGDDGRFTVRANAVLSQIQKPTLTLTIFKNTHTKYKISISWQAWRLKAPQTETLSKAPLPHRFRLRGRRGIPGYGLAELNPCPTGRIWTACTIIRPLRGASERGLLEEESRGCD